MLATALLFLPAYAWESTIIYAGTQGSDIGAMASIRSTPGGDVFIVYQISNFALSPYESRLELVGYDCLTADCAAPALAYGPDPIGGLIRGQPVHPALAIARAGRRVELRILHRERVFEDCDGDGVLYADEIEGDDLDLLDLVEEIWDTRDGYRGRLVVDASTAAPCADRGVSLVRMGPDRQTHACWTHRPDGDPDAISCGSSDGTSWSSTLFDNGGEKEDHAWFDFDELGERITVHRSTSEALAMRDQDGLTVSSYDAGAEEDYPALVISGAPSVWQLTWHEGSASSSAIRYARCEQAAAPSACRDLADFAIETVADSGDNLKHPTLAVDGDLTFLVYMEDVDPGNTKQYRVRVQSRCGTEPWSAPETVREPTDPTWDQLMEYGRPHIALSRVDNVAHIVFTEADAEGPFTDADIVWAHAPYVDCP